MNEPLFEGPQSSYAEYTDPLMTEWKCVGWEVALTPFCVRTAAFEVAQMTGLPDVALPATLNLPVYTMTDLEQKAQASPCLSLFRRRPQDRMRRWYRDHDGIEVDTVLHTIEFVHTLQGRFTVTLFGSVDGHDMVVRWLDTRVPVPPHALPPPFLDPGIYAQRVMTVYWRCRAKAIYDSVYR